MSRMKGVSGVVRRETFDSMTSRFAFVASSALLASLLVTAAGCSDVVDLPVPNEGGGDGGTPGHLRYTLGTSKPRAYTA